MEDYGVNPSKNVALLKHIDELSSIFFILFYFIYFFRLYRVSIYNLCKKKKNLFAFTTHSLCNKGLKVQIVLLAELGGWTFRSRFIIFWGIVEEKSMDGLYFI